MVKKISALFLAFILCLSVMVVPVSSLDDVASGKNVAYELKWDKEYYQAGDTAVLSVFMKVADGYELHSGSVMIALNSAQIKEAAEEDKDTIAANWIASDLYASCWKTSTKAAWSWFDETTTIGGKVETASTTDEAAKFDKYNKLVIARDSSSEIGSDSKAGVPSADINALADAGKPLFQVVYTVADGVEDGTALDAAIVTGTITSTPAQTALKYLKSPGTATTQDSFAASTFDVSAAVATATVGKEPCADDAHVWDAGVVTTQPTCGEVGVKTYTCSVCKSTKTEDVAATGAHTAGDAVKENEVAASCNTAGSYDEVVYCSVCSAEMTRTAKTIDATGDHNYATESSRVEPTCTEDGYVTMACGCGATETTTLTKTGHTEEAIPAVEATCTTDGATAGVKCSVCDEVITAPETIPSAGHTEETVVENEVAATCETDGSYESVVYCTVCDTEISRETVTVPATGHSYGEGKQVKVATCTKAGETQYTCETCGYKDRRAEPAALGHTEEVIPAKPATCLDAGFTEGTKCSTCNINLVSPVRIPAPGHTKSDDGVVTAPTYSSAGYTTYTCATCGVEYKDDHVAKKALDFRVLIKDPSITEIRCKDTIVLHAEKHTGGELPDDVTVVWEADNENFTLNELDDGKLEITSRRKGYTNIKVTIYDAATGEELSSDTIEMYSDAGFFKRIGGFFRTIFKKTAYYEY